MNKGKRVISAPRLCEGTPEDGTGEEQALYSHKTDSPLGFILDNWKHYPNTGDPETPIRVKQYPISPEGKNGLKPEIERLLSKGLLESCMSPFNTPILPIKKADGSYRLVHDLREINKRTVARFPVVANPYTLLSRLGPEKQYYSVIDLKDAFWACPLDEKSKDYFAFEWEDPVTHRRQQLRWTVLPQGFTESPNLFGQALEQILQEYQTGEGVTLIQYVDDLLIAGETEDKVRAESIRLLNFLSAKGLKVSKAKLQFVEEEVKYLGHYLRKGEKKIDPERVKGILSIPPPKSKKQIRQLLGLMGYCRQWIENYSTKVKFLYEKLSQGGLVKWDEKDDKHLKALQHDLVNAPVLSLPDLKRPFYLFVNTDSGTAYGVLTQEWAGKKKPVGYLSKLLDPDGFVSEREVTVVIKLASPEGVLGLWAYLEEWKEMCAWTPKMRTEQLNVGFVYFNEQDIPKGKIGLKYLAHFCPNLIEEDDVWKDVTSYGNSRVLHIPWKAQRTAAPLQWLQDCSYAQSTRKQRLLSGSVGAELKLTLQSRFTFLDSYQETPNQKEKSHMCSRLQVSYNWQILELKKRSDNDREFSSRQCQDVAAEDDSLQATFSTSIRFSNDYDSVLKRNMHRMKFRIPAFAARVINQKTEVKGDGFQKHRAHMGIVLAAPPLAFGTEFKSKQGKVFHPSDQLYGPPLDPLKQVHVFPVLRTPELDTVLPGRFSELNEGEYQWICYEAICTLTDVCREAEGLTE
ncbi:hypothetical protein DUI87_16589 [Hirundo rustica rustica]|uniref:ribonuclease H n=1 Tax=Hirundo rustica rustica TaxID=333673 RepID=A0A3M0K1U7_HIRRU|nr:hypothetical protein DUI87_16589 [Hirundo rustica rustica]